MTNPNKAKGDRWERDIRAYLAEVFGKLVRRPHQEGFKDVGDLHLSPFAIQAKDVAKLSLPATIRAAELQASQAGEAYGIVVHKVRGKGAAEAVVAMSLETFRALAEDYAVARDKAWRYDEVSK